MARKSTSRIETPPCTAPVQWRDVQAEFWQSHGGKWAAPQHYMCTYMAMFPPELPHYFIRRFTAEGDTILDPFSGRGTTPLEAMAQGRFGIGNDLNPLAVALTRGKLSNPDCATVIERLNELEIAFSIEEWLDSASEPEQIKMIFHENTLAQLRYLKSQLDWSESGSDAFIVAILMGAMHGSSRGFLSVPMPNTFSMSPNYIRKYIAEKGLISPNRDVFSILEERIHRALRGGKLPGEGRAIYGDVRTLDSKITHDSTQLIFTSPPYLKVIKYGLYNWIRLWFLLDSEDYTDVDDVLDDGHSLNKYLEFIKESLEATLPLLDRKRGLSCWVIGDVKGLNLAKEVWERSCKNIEVELEDGSVMRYKLLAIVEDHIPDNEKVTRIWNSTEDKSGKATPIDRILIVAPETSDPISYLDNSQIDWIRNSLERDQ